jgi:hypothetical protein
VVKKIEKVKKLIIQKFIPALTLICFSDKTIQAQTIVRDSAIMGPQYTNQIYYDIGTGEKNTALMNNWDIAHTTQGRDNCLRANHAAGLRVFQYPKGKTNSWSTFDTSGFSTWKPLWNDLHAHEKGAFNLFTNVSSWKFGWGTYDVNTKDVVGDSLFVLAWTGPGGIGWSRFLKFWPVIQRANGTLVFKYANLDGSAEVTDSTVVAGSTGMMYKYYKFTGAAKPVREPGTDKWDISFTRYIEPVFNPGSGKIEYYPVMGIESKRGTRVARITGKPYASIMPDSAGLVGAYTKAFKDDLTAIGSNWKLFNNSLGRFEIQDTLSYIVRRTRPNDTSYWLLHMTAVTGSSSGKTFFDRLLLRNSLSASHPTFGQVKLFPNPVSDKMYLSLEDKSFGNARIEVFGTTGQMIRDIAIKQTQDFGIYEIQTSGLAPGIYQLRISNEGSAFATTFIVK